MANIYKDGSNELHELLTRAGASAGASLLIPDLQRPYVWTPNQVTLLIDSLIRGWPFGTLLMWKVSHEELHGIPFRPFWNIVDRTEEQGGSTVTQVNPPSEYHMVLDGQQRVQSLLLALSGDDWGFKLEDRVWSEEIKEQRSRGRQSKYKHWSKASLCFDLDTFAECYFSCSENLLDVDFSKVLVWAVVDPQGGQSSYPKPENYAPPLAKADRQRHIRLSRLWGATKPDASLMEKHFKTSLQILLTDHGLPSEKVARLLQPLAELMSTLRDVKLAKVTYLELQQFNEDIWTRDSYNDAVVNIFTRLNTAGRTLTREEITLAWLKVGWDAAKTLDKSAGACFTQLQEELSSTSLKLEMDELVGAVSLMWSAVGADGKLLTNADLLKGTVIRPMASALSSSWRQVRSACLEGAGLIADLGYEYGSRGHFSSSYALAILWAWLYLAEEWQILYPMKVPEQDDFRKKCLASARGCLDRWILCSQWAGIWAQSSSSTIAAFVKRLHETWRQMAAIKDVVETHRLWSEYLLALIQTFEGEASNYVSTFSTANRERVSGYRNLLWIWHRLDLARWNMSKVPLRAGKKEKTVAEVDHCVSFVLWEDKLKSGLPAKLPDLDDARAVANQLGNCALLEKNFNISKGSKSMKSFLEQIHEFKENKISLNDWASALAMPKELIDSEGASVDAIVGAIEYRDTAVRADLIEFVRGQKVRQDI
jgi:hypothetical protein